MTALRNTGFFIQAPDSETDEDPHSSEGLYVSSSINVAVGDAVVVSGTISEFRPASDPESPLQVSADGYRQATGRIGQLGPAVVVQEGGYDLAAIGDLVVAALDGLTLTD